MVNILGLQVKDTAMVIGASHLIRRLETPSLFKEGNPEEEGSTDTLHRRSLLQSQGPFTLAMGMLTIGI